jgi:hypothetical protein
VESTGIGSAPVTLLSVSSSAKFPTEDFVARCCYGLLNLRKGQNQQLFLLQKGKTTTTTTTTTTTNKQTSSC